MKKLCIGMAFMGCLSVGCATTETQSTTVTPSLGMANPASAFCVEKGGRLEIRNETQGQVGYCHLADGKVIEEWTYFRAHQPQCQAEAAQTLVGQKLISEDALKQKTKAQIVRVLHPNQAATMDYRAERLTVSIDPNTQKILAAHCG